MTGNPDSSLTIDTHQAAENEESLAMNANETAVRNAYQVAERKDIAVVDQLLHRGRDIYG
jgi:hypothetical protein